MSNASSVLILMPVGNRGRICDVEGCWAIPTPRLHAPRGSPLQSRHL